MKNVIKLTWLLVIAGFFAACTKDNNEIKIQNHDQDQMMSIMHQMMSKMDTMKMTKDPDNDFAMMMRMHHQGAIDMANLELKSGSDATMKQMAQSIMTSQQAEITQLTAFLASHPPHTNDPDFDTMQMDNMKKAGKQADLQIINGDIDHDFAILMIGHHQSAIENARLELLHGQEQRMKTMATNIIDAQMKEIDQFQDWLLARGNK
ncbi:MULTISPECIES: DUF305 domain-containing protein [Mucilaginibacter]|jgi:uncharacterized protein (DUF305 family)|uniref:DUF305 domain-containing protein n=2 Tax=Mucilaginibacter TaxID=423349 RepID=A0A6I4I1C4_9SPHI|nr:MULTISPECIES: DUF305 domain-containing protein [Mucilaginibacter]MBB5395021.1 uncharacterized protein (DUF305 family) [Mucilaginibacter sp. AK015]MBS1526527.1 DUF305 domain-containing protein [Bacteroidota bacterium]NCD68864.1 DUF305 domain-containing protein [Mucilaginibacter agri]QQL50551.1 DUF305 domain-containing protein [Mucilaginibacter ginkgonis]